MIPAHAQCNNLECSICFRALAVSPSASSEPGCEPSRSARSSHSVVPSSPSTGLVSHVTTTCEPSPQLDLLPTESVPSMSSVEGSPVRTSARPVTNGVSAASDPVYGANSPESLARFDRGTSSWKTSQRCFIEGWTPFLETWPRSGMTRSGIAYRLPPLVRRSYAIESGLWPTLKSSDAKQVTRNRAYFERRRTIAPDLPVIVALCTPPTKRGVYGRLTPTWCEWLMGFPIEWTELGDSATPSSRKSSRSSAKRS